MCSSQKNMVNLAKAIMNGKRDIGWLESTLITIINHEKADKYADEQRNKGVVGTFIYESLIEAKNTNSLQIKIYLM